MCNIKYKIMRNFTLRNGFLESKCGTRSSFKGFVMFVVMMLMTASSAMAQEAKFEVIDGLRYLLDADTKTAKLLPKAGGYSGDIVVPKKVKGSDGVDYPVVDFGDKCFSECHGLSSIAIPSSVTSLGTECFNGCSGLTSITIPSSVTSLSECCFYECSGLTSITIPSSVTSLGDWCFSYCSDLTSITIPSSITSLGESCFYGCSGLNSISLPSSVTSLGYSCFHACSSLTSIIIPSSVTSLGEDCFSSCSGLTSVIIPSSVTSLGEDCFSRCSGLTSVTIPTSVTSLGKSCFYGCNGLETVYFKGKYCNSSYTDLYIPTTSIIKVPSEYLQDYKDAFGSDYKYIYAWNPDGTGDDTKPVTPCATPSISYASGELKFASETAGAEYHYTIMDADMATDAFSKEGKVSLSAAYKISVYATADGYTASEKAEATLYWINANLDNGTNINQVRTRGVVASAHDGIISLSGLDDGEVVKFFTADGKYLGSTVAANGAASYAVSESLVIAKVGKDSIKIAMK